MNTSPSTSGQKYLTWLLALVTIVALVQTAIAGEVTLAVQIPPAVIGLLFVGFLAYFPIRINQVDINFEQLITLGTAFLYGFPLALWITTLGVLSGNAVYFWSKTKKGETEYIYWENIALTVGKLVTPLWITSLLLNWNFNNQLPETPVDTFVFSVIYIAIYSLVGLVGYNLTKTSTQKWKFKQIGSLIAANFLSLPLIWIIIPAANVLNLWAYIALGLILALLAVFIHNINTTQANLERHIQELSIIDSISGIMRSTLDMEKLLAEIQIQVTTLLQVNNFYVALYAPEEQQIWYPLAVKNGEHQQWHPRPLADRLTDRVIQSAKEILFPRNAHKSLELLGLTPGAEKLQAWLGVPLITSNRTIGCLAVFSLSEESTFTKADLNLLTILSGQISVAVENALLYDQTQNRTTHLENLNQIGVLLTSSLNLEDVLQKVCSAVIEISDGKASAVYLQNIDSREVSLAYAEGLSDEFTAQNRVYSIAHHLRTRCLRTGKPEFITNIAEVTLDPDFLKALQKEKIQSIGDFPLVAPETNIGFISIFFQNEQNFSHEQIHLVQTFTSQAALAVANARLYARTDQALARRANQLSTLEAVGRELSAFTHSEQLFQLILNYAVEYTKAAQGILMIYEAAPYGLEIKGSHGFSEPEDLNQIARDTTNNALTNRKTIHIPDTSSIDENLLPHAILSVPLVLEDRALGALTLINHQPYAFSEHAVSFVNQLSTQAAIVLVNAELYREVQQRLSDQSHLYEVSTQLASSFDLEKIFSTIIDAINKSLGSSLTGLYTWNPDREDYVLQAAIPSTSPEAHLDLPDALFGNQLQGMFANTQHQRKRHYLQLFGDSLPYLNICETCQAIIFPLGTPNKHQGFVISHLPKDTQVVEQNLQIPQAIAVQGATAIQNAVLFSDVLEGRDKISAVLNSVADGVLMVNARGTIILANEQIATFLGIPASDLLNYQFENLPEHVLDIFGYSSGQAQDLQKILVSGHIPAAQKAQTKIITTESGKVNFFESTTAPVWEQSQKIIGLIMVIRDITEAQEVEDAKNLITQTIVHDLKSPMAVIVGALKMMEAELPNIPNLDDVFTQSLAIANRSSNRILNLIDDLLYISRMQSGDMPLTRTTINLKTIIENISSDFIPRVKEADVVLQTQIADNLPEIRMDEQKLTRVITNLLDNALKFSPFGGKITLRVLQDHPDYITIKVADEGPGVPEAYSNKIFEPFVQVPNILPRTSGSGLGLAFCKLTVEALGGKIWVENLPKRGSVFNISLPIQEAS